MDIQELKVLLDLMGFGYLVIDSDLKFYDANDILLYKIGHSRDELSSNINLAIDDLKIIKQFAESNDRLLKIDKQNIFLKKLDNLIIIIFNIFTNKIKSDVRHICHSIRNSLNVVVAFSEISMISTDNNDINENLQKVISSSKDILNISNELHRKYAN